MSLPIRDVVKPSVLSGLSNGRLPASILLSTPGLAGGPVVRLVAPAARSWRAMCAAALKAGITLQATSVADSYRTFDVQYSTFHARYTTQRNTDWEIKVCGGVTYYQRPGTAAAACPGTSNHGLGLAIDVANADGKRLTWLLAHAWAFGWSWELQSEPWHIRYCTGDAIPAAVQTFEEAGDDDMEQSEKLTSKTGLATRTVGQVIADLSNLRDWFYATPDVATFNAPPAGSRAALMVYGPAASLTDADRVAIAAAVAAEIGGKLDNILARLAAAGDALDG